jgi:potassium-transporting ATPase KdpC subunit
MATQSSQTASNLTIQAMLLQALRLFAVMTVLLGVLYPLTVTALANLFFHEQAQGSLVRDGGASNATERIRGSELIAQKSVSPLYFHPRPSAVDYGTVASGASNKSPTSSDLAKAVQERRAAFRTENRLPNDAVVPDDMAFASGSGIDPHISPKSALLQAARIAEARAFSKEQQSALMRLIEAKTERPQFGIFGETRVNVLLLNRAVDGMK